MSQTNARTVLSSRVSILTLGGLFASNAVSVDGPIVSVPDIASHFGVLSGEAQLVTVTYLLGFALGHIPLGLLSDRIGRRPVILGGLIFAVILSFIAALSANLEILIIARFGQGLATAAAALLARSMIKDVADGRFGSQLNSKASSFLAVQIIIVPILSSFLIEWYDWKAVLALNSLYLLLLLGMTFFFIPETMQAGKQASRVWHQFKLSLVSFCKSKQSLIATTLGAFAFATYFYSQI